VAGPPARTNSNSSLPPVTFDGRRDLPKQRIFYPVFNENYARKIARDSNAT
jgi:hypothetical protein